RDLKAAVPQRGADALSALSHRSVGQADGLKVVFGVADIADVHLNFNDVGVNSVYCGALGLEEHSCGSFSLWWRILQESRKADSEIQAGVRQDRQCMIHPQLPAPHHHPGPYAGGYVKGSLSARYRSAYLD